MEVIRRLRQKTVVRYLFVGCSSYVLELSLLLGLISFVHISASAATAVAYWVGLLTAFGLQKVVAFQDYRRELRVLTKQGALFALLTVWNWLFTVWFVSLWDDKWVVITRSVALIIMSAWNYALYKKVIFKQHHHTESNAASMTARAWWQRILHDPFLYWSVAMVVAWRLALEALNQIIGQIVHHTTTFTAAVAQWANWDGHWYLSIDQYGYGSPAFADRQANVAFFPGFPQVVEVISHIIPVQPLYIGLVLNVILTTGSVYLLMKTGSLLAHRFGGARYSRHVALLSGLALLVWPASFFLAAYYAEALLLLGFTGAIYFALTRRLWVSVPFLVMASSSKVTGSVAIATVGVIVLEQWWQERGGAATLLKRWSVVSLGLAGLLAYMAFLKIRFNSALLFYHIEEVWGRNTHGFFVTHLLKAYYRHFFDPANFGGVYYYTLNLMWMVLPFAVLAMGIFTIKVYKLVWPFVFGALIVVIPISTGQLEGLNRYCMALAPVFPFIFLWLSRKVRPALLYALLIAASFAMFGFARGFLAGTVFAG